MDKSSTVQAGFGDTKVTGNLCFALFVLVAAPA